MTHAATQATATLHAILNTLAATKEAFVDAVSEGGTLGAIYHEGREIILCPSLDSLIKHDVEGCKLLSLNFHPKKETAPGINVSEIYVGESH